MMAPRTLPEEKQDDGNQDHARREVVFDGADGEFDQVGGSRKGLMVTPLGRMPC